MRKFKSEGSFDIPGRGLVFAVRTENNKDWPSIGEPEFLW